MSDLNDLSGETYLVEARSINAGLQIVGYGLTGAGGDDQAFRLTPTRDVASVSRSLARTAYLASRPAPARHASTGAGRDTRTPGASVVCCACVCGANESARACSNGL